jgi:hypothetical protein
VSGLPVGSKLAASKEGDAMPFDGIFVLPGSPLARLLEADRKLTAERRWAARLREKTVLPAIKSAWRLTQARESVIVLDLLSDLLHGGHYWVRTPTTMTRAVTAWWEGWSTSAPAGAVAIGRANI